MTYLSLNMIELKFHKNKRGMKLQNSDKEKNVIFSYELGTFVFNSSGSEIKESMWAKNQPDNLDGLEHCITVSKKGLWYDELCYLEKNFVCEDLNDTLSFWKACPLGWDLVDKKCYIKG